jgi:fibronectin type 3 domain-containing protein
VCRLAAGLCDVAEVCDGVSPACPADKYAPTTTVCRTAAGLCDIAESCSGSSPDCPVDAFLTKGAVCRPAAGLCDLAESCPGTGPDCPADSMAPAETVCRASTDSNQCDPAETCTGSSVSCPADVAYTRPAAPTFVTAAPATLQATIISWTAVSGATGYNVKRSATSGSGYTTQGTPPTATASPYVNTALTGGVTYYYVVSSVNTLASCESANSTPVSVTPTGTCTPPAVPTVTPTSSNGQVSLSWTASTGAISYAVARSTTTGTGYVSVAAITTGTTYSDINVSNGTTYYYVVTASNGSCSSANSVEVSGTPSCTPPAVPAGLVAAANNGSVALTWTAPAGAVSYRVLRSTTSGSGYVLVGTSGTAGYTDTSVTNGTTYYYVVTASNGVCSSANSAQAPVTPACTPPSKPTGLAATPGNGQIALAWTASTGGATLYQVLRGTATGGPYAAIATPTSTGDADTGLINGTTYYYVVNASNGSCSSANSAELAAAPVCTPPSVPTLTAAPGDGKVVLSWTAATGGAVSYVLSRGTVSGGPYGTVVASPTVLTYTDTTAVNGTTYYYVVSSFNGTCYSLNSAEVLDKPVAACNLVAPTGVTATPLSQQVRLNWTAVTNATSYGIGRSTTAGTGYTSVGTVTAPTVTFLDTAATNGTKYYYVVTASNTLCTSPASTEASATPVCTPPAVPTVTAAADNTNGHINVSWGIVTGATGYTVSRGTSGSGPFTAVSTNQTAATYTDSTGLTAGTVYYYVVSASNAGGTCASANSTPAASARSCTLPSVPSNVKATAGISRVTVSWTASTGSPTSYEVKRGDATGGPFTSIGTPTATSYVDSGVNNGQIYFYVVAARNAGGNCSSANSGVSSTAPRSCTVWSGNAVSAGHPPAIGNLDGICYVTCDPITNWGCSNTDGRSITINGGPLACSAGPIPAAKTPGYDVIDVSAGTYAGAQVFWGASTWVNNCSIPSGGLDF